MWRGDAEITDEESQVTLTVVPDKMPLLGEFLFYVSFLGSTRDRIPTQHYMIAAMDVSSAIKLAYQRYVLEPRHRKGSSLRVLTGAPPYVLFELGARWGKGLFLGPVLACGATMKTLGPISGINAVEATKEADMHQFLADIGDVLSRKVSNPSVYLGELKTLIGSAQKEAPAGA